MKNTSHYAHSLPDRPPADWEPLDVHLDAVAKRAEHFADAFGAGEWGRLAGQWHDLGKYSQAFQKYLHGADGLDAHLEGLTGRVDHSTAGAQHAVRSIPNVGRLVGYVIAGHHAGLADAIKLDQRLLKEIEPYDSAPSELLKSRSLSLPPFKIDSNRKRASFQIAFFTRMFFSCLVDADFLATEAFMNANQAAERPQNLPELSDILLALDSHIEELESKARGGHVNECGQLVLSACRQAAPLPPGLFSLTVPTGGGKTLSSLEQDPNSGVAPFGFSRQNISFCVVLNKDGSLLEIQDLRKQDEKKIVKLPVVVLGNAKPSGSGVNPCFLWDNPAYMLGYKPDDSKPERTLEALETFRQKHLDAEAEINAPAFSAVCRFLESWDPATATEHEKLVQLGTGFGVFKIRAARAFVHDLEAVQSWWRSQIERQEKTDEETVGQCLVTGDIGPLARLHEPRIKGVWGGQSAGAGIVSFNLDAFESYGKSQSFNAPVSEQVAFQYCTALNRLLAGKQRLQLGDTTVTYWTEKPSPAENFLGLIFDPHSAAEDEDLQNQLGAILKQISTGRYPNELGKPKTPFYVLGLSPNAARISVRFWRRSTLEDLNNNLQAHFRDLAIDRGPKDPEFLAPWQLLRETARESKDIPPLLGGALLRAILTKSRYPDAFYLAVLRRIRADREVRYTRAATIKAHLNRNYGKEISMSLDPDRPESSYQLGRLFAELEKTQEDALPGINDTIKDRYFGSASATPASVFPRLIRLSQHHLGKLEKPGKIFHEKRIQEIVNNFTTFPRHLNLQDQGLFSIGYYHQRRDIFTKKPAITTEMK